MAAAPIPLETPPCPLCGSPGGGIVVGTKGRFDMDVRNIACHECALVYQSPRPTYAAMMEYYAGEYRRQYANVRFPNGDDTVGLGEPGYEAAMDAWHRFQAEASAKLSTPAPGARVLEIGCRHGRTLSIMRERFGIEPHGIEPGPEEAALANAAGVRCFNGTLEAFEPGDLRFDVIQLFHVFEHLYDPLDALVRMRRLLSPGGRIVIEVPNVHQPYGLLEENFFQNAHTTNFSAETLPAILARAGLISKHLVDEEVLFVLAVPDGEASELPRPFSHDMLAPPRHPATWVAERLATYHQLEKLDHLLHRHGPSMELLQMLTKLLQGPSFVPHTVRVVTRTVEYFVARNAPRAAAAIAASAAMGADTDEVREGFEQLAAAVGANAA